MIITNGPAILFLLLSLGISFAFGWFLGLFGVAEETRETITGYGLCGLLLLFDLGMRFLVGAGNELAALWKRLVFPSFGGHVFWIPIWVIVGVAFLLEFIG